VSFRLVLEGKPFSKKNGWRRNPNGPGMYIAPECRDYIESIQLQAKCQMAGLGVEPIRRPANVAARFQVFFTKRQQMDAHNAAETVLDALQGIAYDNDKQVAGWHHPPVRFIDDKRPRVEVELMDDLEAAGDRRWL
jgi:Holliday junction resolvase RusA-like endonuclease